MQEQRTTARRAVAAAIIVAVLFVAMAAWMGFDGGAPDRLGGQGTAADALPAAVVDRKAAAVDRATVGVDCEVTVALEPGKATLAEHDPDANIPVGDVEVRTGGEWIHFEPTFAAGLGILDVRGYEPVAFAWASGACIRPIELKEQPVATVRGVVRGVTDVVTDYWVSGCERGASLSEDHSFEMNVPVTEPCELHVFRVFGVSDLHGPSVTITPILGDVVEVELVAPSPPGGAGWDVMEVDDGFVVMGLVEGMPAETAGLRVGDRVLSVDGEDAADVSEDGMHDLPVTVEFVRGGEAHEAVIAAPGSD